MATGSTPSFRSCFQAPIFSGSKAATSITRPSTSIAVSGNSISVAPLAVEQRQRERRPAALVVARLRGDGDDLPAAVPHAGRVGLVDDARQVEAEGLDRRRLLAVDRQVGLALLPELLQ